MEESMADDSPTTKGDILALGESLRMVLQELDSFRTEIKERLNGLELRLDNLEHRVDGLERRIDEGLHEIEVKLTRRMDDFAASLEEQIRDSQTEVLKAMLPRAA
jgi:chaperonin cofactor prefoldin